MSQKIKSALVNIDVFLRIQGIALTDEQLMFIADAFEGILEDDFNYRLAEATKNEMLIQN